MPRPARPVRDLTQFIPGVENRLSWRAASQLAEAPNELPAPVVFHGPAECGKSHLIAGLCRATRRMHPGLTQRHVTAAQLTRRVQRAYQHKETCELTSELGGLDMLVVDDLDQLATRKATQSLLCAAIDRILDHGGQVVCAAPAPPRRIDGLAPCLANRLHQGLLMRVDPPSAGTLGDLLKRQLPANGLRLNPEHQAFIVSRQISPTQLGRLVALLGRLAASGRPLNRAVIDEALTQLAATTTNGARATLEAILRRVADGFGVSPGVLARRGGPRRLAQARRLAILLAREQEHPRPCIAIAFDIQPSSVSAAVRKVRSEIASDDQLAQTLDDLRDGLPNGR